MSTSPFASVPVQKLPGLACKGIVSEVPEVKATESGDYYMTRIKIQGLEGSKDVVLNLLFRPEWLRPGFDPIKELQPLVDSADPVVAKRGNSFMAVYKNNIGGTNSQPSNLKGLVGGTDESLIKFAEARDVMYNAKNSGKTAEEAEDLSSDEIHGLLSKFLLQTQGGKVLGYTLKQANQKTDDVDDNGKPIYELRSNYEIANWFVPTEKNIRGLFERAKKANPPGSFRVAFSQ